MLASCVCACLFVHAYVLFVKGFLIFRGETSTASGTPRVTTSFIVPRKNAFCQTATAPARYVVFLPEQCYHVHPTRVQKTGRRGHVAVYRASRGRHSLHHDSARRLQAPPQAEVTVSRRTRAGDAFARPSKHRRGWTVTLVQGSGPGMAGHADVCGK